VEQNADYRGMKQQAVKRRKQGNTDNAETCGKKKAIQNQQEGSERAGKKHGPRTAGSEVTRVYHHNATYRKPRARKESRKRKKKETKKEFKKPEKGAE